MFFFETQKVMRLKEKSRNLISATKTLAKLPRPKIDRLRCVETSFIIFIGLFFQTFVFLAWR